MFYKALYQIYGKGNQRIMELFKVGQLLRNWDDETARIG